MHFLSRCSAALALISVFSWTGGLAPAIAIPSDRFAPFTDSLSPANPVSPLTDSPSPAATYTLSAGDRINVVIANIPEYSGTYQLLVDGAIDLPVLGTINLAGMTTEGASEAIAHAYATAQILVEPVVNVILAEANVLHIAVVGEVNRPGAYTLQPNNGELPTLSQAIEAAGGITQRTDLQSIQIHRTRRLSSPEIVEVSLWRLLNEGDISQNAPLRDGDVVMLTAAEAIAPNIAEQLGSTSFAPVSIQVNLVGEVKQAGLLQVPPNTSLNQALLTAGGFTSQARRGSVELVRLNPNGTLTRRRVEIDFDDDINDDTNPILHNRDVVIIGRSTIARFSDTIGTILSPLGSALSLFNFFSPFFGSSSP